MAPIPQAQEIYFVSTNPLGQIHKITHLVEIPGLNDEIQSQAFNCARSSQSAKEVQRSHQLVEISTSPQL